MRKAMMATPGDIPQFRQPTLDAVGLFEELRLGYALVGGVAAMFYGRSRFTEDIDFVVQAEHMQTLAERSDAMRKWHFDPNCTWMLYHESGVDIDIWKDEFADEIVGRAKTIELMGTNLKIAEPHDLIAMKLRAGRLQDDYDISEIIRGTPIDDEIVKARVTAEQFEHYLSVKQRVT